MAASFFLFMCITFIDSSKAVIKPVRVCTLYMFLKQNIWLQISSDLLADLETLTTLLTKFVLFITSLYTAH